MGIDETIDRAIREATHRQRQGDTTAEKLLKWFEQIASGNEAVEDKESAYRHVEGICNSIVVELTDEEDA